MTGYIKLYRQLLDGDSYSNEKFDKTHAWIDMLLNANWEQSKIIVRGIEITVSRGQIAKSISEIASRWHWSKSSVISFLDDLEAKKQIHREKNNVLGIITIENYEKYQGNDEFSESSTAETAETATRTASSTANQEEIPPYTPKEENIKEDTRNKESKSTNVSLPKKDRIKTKKERFEENEAIFSNVDINDKNYGSFVNYVRTNAYAEIYTHMNLPSKEYFEQLKEKYGAKAMAEIIIDMVNKPSTVAKNKLLGPTMRDWLEIRERR